APWMDSNQTGHQHSGHPSSDIRPEPGSTAQPPTRSSESWRRAPSVHPATINLLQLLQSALHRLLLATQLFDSHAHLPETARRPLILRRSQLSLYQAALSIELGPYRRQLLIRLGQQRRRSLLVLHCKVIARPCRHLTCNERLPILLQGNDLTAQLLVIGPGVVSHLPRASGRRAQGFLTLSDSLLFIGDMIPDRETRESTDSSANESVAGTPVQQAADQATDYRSRARTFRASSLRVGSTARGENAGQYHSSTNQLPL